MNRLEKLKLEMAESQCERITSTLVDADTRKRHFIKGFDAASAEYEKIIAELEAALKEAKSCYSCIRHNCKIDSFLLALDVGSQITIKHIDYSEKQVKEALQKLKQFKGDE